MEIPYRSFIASHPFSFLVGPSQKTFYVHAELVAQCSGSMAALVRGPMTEAQHKCAILEDVDEETIVRFIEFLYTQDYTVPDPEIVLTSSDIGPEPDMSIPFAEVEGELSNTSGQNAEAIVESPDGFTAFYCSGKRKKKNMKTPMRNVWREEEISPPAEPCYGEDASGQRKPKKDSVWSNFKGKASVLEHVPWQPRQNSETYQDYTQVFLSHTQLYIFSDQYNIEPLQQLVLQKLRLTLSMFTLFEERVPDVVELVRYTYAHTMDHEKGIDKLRSLVMDYVVCHIEVISKHEYFRKILQEAGALAKDLVLKMLQRLD